MWENCISYSSRTFSKFLLVYRHTTCCLGVKRSTSDLLTCTFSLLGIVLVFLLHMDNEACIVEYLYTLFFLPVVALYWNFILVDRDKVRHQFEGWLEKELQHPVAILDAFGMDEGWWCDRAIITQHSCSMADFLHKFVIVSKLHSSYVEHDWSGLFASS